MENTKLKIARISHGFTQETLADELGMSRQAYAAVESGKTKGNVKFWIKVQKALNIPGEEMWSLINGKKEGTKV